MKAHVVNLAVLIILLISEALAEDDQKVNFNFFPTPSFFIYQIYVAFILLLNPNKNYFHLGIFF